MLVGPAGRALVSVPAGAWQSLLVVEAALWDGNNCTVTLAQAAPGGDSRYNFRCAGTAAPGVG